VPDIRQHVASKAELDAALAKLAEHEQALPMPSSNETRQIAITQPWRARLMNWLSWRSRDRKLSMPHINEAATRQRLIDVALTDAGWNVGANGTYTEEDPGGGSRPSTHAHRQGNGRLLLGEGQQGQRQARVR
jgi:hypothetical protein